MEGAAGSDGTAPARRELPVHAPWNVAAGEVERLLARVAAENGAVIAERVVLDEPAASTA